MRNFFLRKAFPIRAKYFGLPDTLLNPEYKHRKRFCLDIITAHSYDFTERLKKGVDIEYHESWGNTNPDIECVYNGKNVIQSTSFGLVKIRTMIEPKQIKGWFLGDDGSIVHMIHGCSSGMIRFLDKLVPGYLYSFRMQCADFVGSWTALWLFDYGDGIYREIDILEQFYKDAGDNKEIQINTQFGKANKRKHKPSKIKGFDFSNQMFDIDLLWLKEELSIFINGVIVYKLTNHNFTVPMELMFGVGVKDFGNGVKIDSNKNAVLYHVNKYQVL